MLDKIFTLLSALIVRILPLILSYTTFCVFGLKNYNQLVILLTTSSVVSIFPSLFVGPLILTERDSTIANKFAIYGVIIGTVLSFLLSYILSRFLDNILITISIFLYSSSLIIGVVLNALMNRALFFRQSFVFSFILVFLPIFFALFINFVLNISFDQFLVFTMSVYFFVSVVLYLVTLFVNEKKQGAASIESSVFKLKAFITSGSFSGLTGLFVASGFYIINKFAYSSGSEVSCAAYLLSFQLFSIIIFIPGALGSYFVSISNQNCSKKNVEMDVIKIGFMYVKISAFVCCILFSFSIIFLKSIYDTNLFIYLGMLFASLLASFNAAINQYFVSTQNFSMLVCISFMWLVILLLVMYVLPLEILSCIVALNISYLVAILLGLSLREKRLNYFFNQISNSMDT